MKQYCGTDIIEINRIKTAINSTTGFKEKIFTPLEIKYAEHNNNVHTYEHFAGRFAAKEAVYKSISKVYPKILLSQIEILNDINNYNRPYVVIHDKKIKNKIENEKILIDISISHVKSYAIGFAITTFL